MLGVLCARPKPWLFASLSLSHAHGSAPAAYNRLIGTPTKSVLVGGSDQLQRRHHSSHCRLGASVNRGGAASIWHAILPAGRRNKDVKRRNTVFHHHHYELAKKGEGSWNVAWDTRPARWLHNPDSAWLLFGVCSCLAAPSLDLPDSNSDVVAPIENMSQGFSSNTVNSDEADRNSANYTVTGTIICSTHIRHIIIVLLLFKDFKLGEFILYQLFYVEKRKEKEGGHRFRAIETTSCTRNVG